MSHTKGKLQTCGLYAANEKGRAVFDCRLIPMEEEEIRANARRLVACWNALECVPTEWLENYVFRSVKNVIQENAALKAENKQLREVAAAAERLIYHLGRQEDTFDAEEQLEQALNAIKETK